MPLLLNILNAARQESADTCVLFACHILLPGLVARQACQCLGLPAEQGAPRRAAVARMKGFTLLMQLQFPAAGSRSQAYALCLMPDAQQFTDKQTHLNSSILPLKTSTRSLCRAGPLVDSEGPALPKELNTSSRKTPPRACKSSL